MSNAAALVLPDISEGAGELTTRDKVGIIQDEMRKHEQIDIPVEHLFAHGLYARQGVIPAGTLATGKIHKFSQLNIISKGDISVLMENGEVKRFTAPATIVSPPGTRRLVYAHSDTQWTTIHGTHETDVEKIELMFTAATEEEYAAFLTQQKALESPPCG